MMHQKTKIWLVSCLILIFLSSAMMIASAQNSFKIIVLGSGGGIDESNLSSYLFSDAHTDRYICLDAGTLMHGLVLSAKKGHFDHLIKDHSSMELAAEVLHHHMDAYLISHAHLDHISGMLLAAPFDNHKSIMCSKSTADDLIQNIFQSNLWANFTTEGDNPIGKWNIIRMENELWYDIPNNSMKVKPYSLCHSCPHESNAFLIETSGNYCLYFGDTGADELEGKPKLEHIFKDISHLVKNNLLKAIFIEVSFPNKQENSKLYGHLKPELLEKELKKLAYIVNPENPILALQGLKIFITHIKPDYQIIKKSKETILEELSSVETYGAEFIIAEQSEKYEF